MDNQTHEALNDIARENVEASIKSHEREDDEDHSEEESNEARIARMKEVDTENRCGKPHNNGDDTCYECEVIKLNI